MTPYKVFGVFLLLAGGFVIGDWKIVTGVFLLMWGNNIGRNPDL
jgi:hypothetical protein